jgi:GntR family transcriptional regulator
MSGDGVAMIFRLENDSGVPPYRQIVQQVEQALLLGYLRPGDQLPRLRDVVRDLAVNPNTVQKAYRDLEVRGLTEGRPGSGTFVRPGAGSPAFADLVKLRRRLRTWMQDARQSGLGDAEVQALIALTLREHQPGLAQLESPAAGASETESESA